MMRYEDLICAGQLRLLTEREGPANAKRTHKAVRKSVAQLVQGRSCVKGGHPSRRSVLLYTDATVLSTDRVVFRVGEWACETLAAKTPRTAGQTSRAPVTPRKATRCRYELAVEQPQIKVS